MLGGTLGTCRPVIAWPYIMPPIAPVSSAATSTSPVCILPVPAALCRSPFPSFLPSPTLFLFSFLSSCPSSQTVTSALRICDPTPLLPVFTPSLYVGITPGDWLVPSVHAPLPYLQYGLVLCSEWSLWQQQQERLSPAPCFRSFTMTLTKAGKKCKFTMLANSYPFYFSLSFVTSAIPFPPLL